MSPARDKPPYTVSVLNRWLTEWSHESGHSASRLRNLTVNTAAATMLQRATAGDGGPLLVFKGGGGLQLRLGLRARTSKDLDAAARDDLEAARREIERVLSLPWCDITGTITVVEEVPVDWMTVKPLRLVIKLRHKAKSLGTVPLEIAPPELDAAQSPDLVAPAEALEQVGLPAHDGVACIPVAWQIAQKLHACTDPGPEPGPEPGPDPEPGGGGNERARDLVDLLLLQELVVDWAPVREVCTRVFAHRARHTWPPTVRTWPGWPRLWTRLAEDGETTMTLQEAVGSVQDLIARIEIEDRSAADRSAAAS